MPGRARKTFEQHAEAAGLEGPPRGALASYAEEDVLTQIPRLLAACGEDDDERRHALREMESAARGLLDWITDTPDRRPARASRAARGTPVQATTPTPPPRASARTATVRARYRRRTP